MSTGRLVSLIAIGLFGLAGLIVSNRAGEEIFYWGGLAAFVLAVVCLFVVIGRPDRHGKG